MTKNEQIEANMALIDRLLLGIPYILEICTEDGGYSKICGRGGDILKAWVAMTAHIQETLEVDLGEMIALAKEAFEEGRHE